MVKRHKGGGYCSPLRRAEGKGASLKSSSWIQKKKKYSGGKTDKIWDGPNMEV